MSKKALSKTAGLCLGAIALIALGTAGTAQIERLTLRQMVNKTDNCVLGTITDREVIRIDHPVDGPELYYTFLTIEGRSLLTDEPLTVEVAYPGGFIDKNRGVHNSEAPSDEDTRIGNRVVAFYKWIDNMGGDLAANCLYASHGGLYRTFDSQGKVIIQGRGEGYAIETNTERLSLSTRVREVRERK
jgi:hypothetical protein